jgi:hypothetical protein
MRTMPASGGLSPERPYPTIVAGVWFAGRPIALIGRGRSPRIGAASSSTAMSCPCEKTKFGSTRIDWMPATPPRGSRKTAVVGSIWKPSPLQEGPVPVSEQTQCAAVTAV